MAWVNFSLAMYDPAESPLQLRAESVLAQRLAGHQKRDPAPAELPGDVAEGRRQVGVAHRVHIAARGEVQADSARPPHRDGRIDDLEHQARPVFDGSAVLVGPMVRAVLQELVEQVAIGAVDLDTVESGGLGVFGTQAEGLDDRRGSRSSSRARGVGYGRWAAGG